MPYPSGTASDRGFGPGWPNCDENTWTTVHFHGEPIRLRQEAATLFLAFLTDYDREVEPVVNGQLDDWGADCRPIRGSAQPSNHSWGIAVDINAPKHPLGQRGTFTPAQLKSLRHVLARPAFRHLWWGGDFVHRADEQHHEFVGTLADLALDTALLHPPTTEDDDMVRLVRATSDAKVFALTPLHTKVAVTAQRDVDEGVRIGFYAPVVEVDAHFLATFPLAAK